MNMFENSQQANNLIIVLEDIYQPHNAQSIIRSCDAFGVKQIYIICNKNAFRLPNHILKDVESWVSLKFFQEADRNNTEACLKSLKQDGYQIVVTSLRPNSLPLDQLPIQQKTALCFGTEEKGLSEVAHDWADYCTYLPMFGLTQSFNVSVSVALSLYQLTNRA